MILSTLCFLIFLHNQKKEKERIKIRIRMSEDYENARNNFKSGNFEKTINFYDEILKKYPDQDWLWLQLGDIYSETNDYTKALSCYFKIKSCIEYIGERQILLRIGGIYEKVGKIDSAKFYYNKILQTKSKIDKHLGFDNDRETTYCRLGEIAFNNANYNDAIKYLSEAIEIQRIPKSLYIRANAYYLTGKYDLAQKDYDESIDLIRKIYINEHPYFKDILCDTCGTFFGKDEYMAVLKEWRNFDERIKESNKVDSITRSRIEYKIAVDSIPKWYSEIDSLRGKTDSESILKFNALNDSLKKYANKTVRFNIYE